MAQSTNYNEPFFWHRIVNVGWGGGWGVLTIDLPDGLSVDFDSGGDWQPLGSGIGPYDIDELVPHEDIVDDGGAAIFPVSFEPPIPPLEELYNIPTRSWLYQTPGGIRAPTGTDVSAQIAEILEDFPGALMAMCAGSSLQNPPFGETVSMNELVVPECGHPPFSPGFDNYFFYYITENPPGENKRNAVRKVYLINFAVWPVGKVVEIRTNIDGADENLPAYNITARLTRYVSSAALKGASNTITGTPAGVMSSLATSYVQPSLGFIRRAGPMTRSGG